MRSAFDLFSTYHVDRLSPEAKHILAGLPDNVLELAFDTWEAAAAELMVSLNYEAMTVDERLEVFWERVAVRAREQLARNVPALGVLSDNDLDVVISAAGNSETVNNWATSRKIVRELQKIPGRDR